MLAGLLSLCTFSLSAQIHREVYRCAPAQNPIVIDGTANESGWLTAAWSQPFVDIEGDKKPKPYRDTRVKMLWDQYYFYFYAEMEEPHLWAKLKQRDTVIFYDNDFEVFIDPDGDTHNYYELELNAFNTVWDLLLTRPYRDGGHAIDHWDIHGLKSAVKLNGTLNDPTDEDEGWSVEIAIPWDELSEATRMKTPPVPGDTWRVNFSRVQWETEVVNGRYVKKKDPETGKRLRENNWVWSPMRAIAMHEPEFWGKVEFVIDGRPETDRLGSEREEKIRYILYAHHRGQISYFRKNKAYASKVNDLEIDVAAIEITGLQIHSLTTNEFGYQMILRDDEAGLDYYIDQTGKSHIKPVK